MTTIGHYPPILPPHRVFITITTDAAKAGQAAAVRELIECGADEEGARQAGLLVRDGSFGELREYTPAGLEPVFSSVLKRRLNLGT